MKPQDTILVIDMQKVYLPGNPWACAGIEAASNCIVKLLDAVVARRDATEVVSTADHADRKTSGSEEAGHTRGIAAGSGGQQSQAAPTVYLTRFIAAADEDTQGVWSDYNRMNQAINEHPVMNEFLPEIARYVEDFPYIDKCTYSCFSNEYIRVAADRSMVHGGSIVLTGVVAECCVLASFFEGTDAGYHFIYLTDACAGVNADSEQAVETVLRGLAPLHVELMTTEEYLQRDEV